MPEFPSVETTTGGVLARATDPAHAAATIAVNVNWQASRTLRWWPLSDSSRAKDSRRQKSEPSNVSRALRSSNRRGSRR